MFKPGETVCVLNKFGLYEAFVFQCFLEDKCILESRDAKNHMITEQASNVFKADAVIRLINDQINECHAMIDHFIKLKNEEEIASWRKYLQKAKYDKRRLKNL